MKLYLSLVSDTTLTWFSFCLVSFLLSQYSLELIKVYRKPSSFPGVLYYIIMHDKHNTLIFMFLPTDAFSEPHNRTPTALLTSPLRGLTGPKTQHVQNQTHDLPARCVLHPSVNCTSIPSSKQTRTMSHSKNSNSRTGLHCPHATYHQSLEIPQYRSSLPRSLHLYEDTLA